MTTTETKRQDIPTRQIAAILIGFPALYMLNSFTPWSRNLFANNDFHGAWFAFWGSAFVLHWASAIAALVVMRRHGWTLRDAGIAPQGVKLIAVLAAVGALAVVVREAFGRLNAFGIAHAVRAWSAEGAPHTTTQRVVWIFMGVVTAAFCEEFVYRGFGFHALKKHRPIAIAAVLASLAWIGVHGLGAIFGFPGYVALAIPLTGLVILTDSLVPSIALHAAIHVFVILGS